MILGDMFELGQEQDKEHVNVINQSLNSGIKEVYFVGDIFSRLNQTAYKSFKTTNELKQYFKRNQMKEAFVLIKGSRGMKLEQLLDCL